MAKLDKNQCARRTVFLETFGCQMNELDSQLVRSQLQGLGYSFVDDWKQADILLYNTCSVREKAENKVYSRIGQVGIHKRKHPHVVLGVIGCMAERERTDMVRRQPQIDLLCGPGELDKIPMLLNNVARTRLQTGVPANGIGHVQTALQGNKHRRTSTLAAAEDQLELLDLSRSFSPDEHRGSAYVRITRGCNKFCTFCVVPFTRGAEVHRPPVHILDECKRLVDNGVIEITLIGQTVNHYHYNHDRSVLVNSVQQPQVGAIVKNNGNTSDNQQLQPVGVGHHVTSFADLLQRIHSEVQELQRLRFVTSFPRDFGDDILQVMRDCPRICRYLHLPVQTASNRLLKMMNRGYNIEQYCELVNRAREYLPDCELATDIICGFPTETEQDHRATADLLRYCRFKNAFIFKYSPRPGTSAYDRLNDDVPDPIKRRRNNELLAVQSQVSTTVHTAYVGRTVRVFVESISEKVRRSQNTADPNVQVGWDQPQEVTQLVGRTDGDLIVIFDGDPLLVGSIVKVQVERSAPLILFGRLTNTKVVI